MPQRAVYVCNLMSASVSVLDPDRRELKRTMHVGEYPVFAYVYPPDPKKILVTLHNYGKKDGGGCLLLVDPSAGSVAQKLTYPGIAVPSGMAWDTKRDVLYVADENLNRIWIHDGRTLKILSSLPAGTAPAHLAISRDGDHLAVANRLSSDLSVWDLKKMTAGEKETGYRPSILQLTGSAGAPSHPFDVKVPRTVAACYITDFNNGEVLVADTRSGRITGRIRTGEKAFGAAMDAKGARMYVCNMGSGTVSVLQPGKNRKSGDIAGLYAPCHAIIDDNGGQVIVSDQGGPAGAGVSFIDTDTEKITGTVADAMIRSPIGVTLAE